jgi:hypothetical protein
VLDNCEHVVEATARLAEAVLTRCPDIAVLATSREVLGVPGGTAFPTVPAAVAAAVAIQVGRHRISSGPTEAINLLIKKIKRTRLPQLRQLPASPAALLRHRLGHSPEPRRSEVGYHASLRRDSLALPVVDQ